MRGLLISPALELNMSSGSFSTGAFDAQLAKMWVLYWDKLAWHSNNSLSIVNPSDPVLVELRNSGVLQEHEYRERVVHIETGAKTLFSYVIRNWNDLEKQDLNSWAISRGNNTLLCNALDHETGNGLQFDLVSALPVPAVDTPMDRIFAYREKCADERMAMWAYLDEVYQSILNSPDQSVSESTAFGKLEAALEDQMKNAKSFNNMINFDKGSLTAQYDVVKAIQATIAAVSVGVPFSTSLLVGAGAGINLKAGPSLKLSWKEDRVSPLAYACNVEGRLNWG